MTVTPAVAGLTDDSVRDVTTPSASLAVRPAVVAAPSRAVIGEGHVTTTGALPPATLCAPRPPNVSWAKPSHSSAGSNVSAPFGSPAWTVSLRRSVLSAVLVSPLPHSVPGSTPIWPTTSRTVEPLRSTIASSPLNHDVPEVWSATPRISGPALVGASTNASWLTSVPVRLIVSAAAVEPLKYIWTLYPCEARSIADPVLLKNSTALLKLDPSTYSEMNRSDEAAKAPGAPISAQAIVTTAMTRRRRIGFSLPCVADGRLGTILCTAARRPGADTAPGPASRGSLSEWAAPERRGEPRPTPR